MAILVGGVSRVKEDKEDLDLKLGRDCVAKPGKLGSERVAGALANLAANDKCSKEVAIAGGVHALLMFARNCKFKEVQEQAFGNVMVVGKVDLVTYKGPTMIVSTLHGVALLLKRVKDFIFH
ncbi:Armadillo-like helical [Sesbania bispinosa]|nr:Armadillo-like helical [Sesbania bispinosa]